MKHPLLASMILSSALTGIPFGAGAATGDADWVLVKSLVIQRPLANDPHYTTTTETFINRKSIGPAGVYKKAAFRQAAKDSTGYEMVYGRDKILWYYYDCKGGKVAGASDTQPDAGRFVPYAQFNAERPKMPFADAKVVAMVCGAK